MAAFNGSDGSVTIEDNAAGTVVLLHIAGWSFSWNREKNDVTEFATTTGWKAKIPGLCKITGTLNGFYQDAAEDALIAANLVLDAIHLILKADASRTFTFTEGINLTNFDLNVETGTPNTWSCSFSANVVPTIA